MTRRPLHILFVCLGNICRSPLAEGVFRGHVEAAGLAEHFEIASAGTGDWHEGEPPDSRMCATALEHGVDLSRQRARALRLADLGLHDLILVMDRSNLENTRRLFSGRTSSAEIRLFRHFDPEPGTGEVPDPYHGGPEGFAQVFALVDRTSRALLQHLRNEHGL